MFFLSHKISARKSKWKNNRHLSKVKEKKTKSSVSFCNSKHKPVYEYEETHFWKYFTKWSRINCHWGKSTHTHTHKQIIQPTVKSKKSYILCEASCSTLECMRSKKNTSSTSGKKRSIFKCFNNFVRKTFLINCRAEIYLSICIKCIKNYCVCTLLHFHTDDDDDEDDDDVSAKAILVFIYICAECFYTISYCRM